MLCKTLISILFAAVAVTAAAAPEPTPAPVAAPWIVGHNKRAATPTGLTKTIPASAGSTAVATAIKIAAGKSFDGGMKKYDRNPKVCAGQTETGEKDAMFILEEGATLSNVIIGPNQAEGVHCKGTCTLNNVWWVDVCEGEFKIPYDVANARN